MLRGASKPMKRLRSKPLPCLSGCMHKVSDLPQGKPLPVLTFVHTVRTSSLCMEASERIFGLFSGERIFNVLSPISSFHLTENSNSYGFLSTMALHSPPSQKSPNIHKGQVCGVNNQQLFNQWILLSELLTSAAPPDLLPGY